MDRRRWWWLCQGTWVQWRLRNRSFEHRYIHHIKNLTLLSGSLADRYTDLIWLQSPILNLIPSPYSHLIYFTLYYFAPNCSLFISSAWVLTTVYHFILGFKIGSMVHFTFWLMVLPHTHNGTCVYLKNESVESGSWSKQANVILIKFLNNCLIVELVNN